MTNSVTADVAIIGSGFGGSLTALLLSRAGLRPVLIDRAAHPRFALGESSTPIADLILQQLARRYDLPRIAPLAEYGTWQRSYPQLTCGLKRGFSYFQHRPDQPFTPRGDHANELLVAASVGDADADTHWFRAEFDAFLVGEVRAAGIPYFDLTEICEVVDAESWRLSGRRSGEPVHIAANFVIDASGEGRFLAQRLGVPESAAAMRTCSRAVYGHFTGVRRWADLLAARGGRIQDHPFGCDDAALHHIFDHAWMWVLRFNNGVTSAGIQLDAARFPLDESRPPADEWQTFLNRYPSVAEQFASAQITPACGQMRRTGRIQRRVARAAGCNWAMLPLTAYALDALHSTGNAHNLCGIERLVSILERRPGGDELTRQLNRYDAMLQTEITLLDELVHGCYAAFGQFELLVAFAMFYFAGATFSECARREETARTSRSGRPLNTGPRTAALDELPAFLLADRATFREHLSDCAQRVVALAGQPGGAAPGAREGFRELVAGRLAAVNIAGLCDPGRHNLYPFSCPIVASPDGPPPII